MKTYILQKDLPDAKAGSKFKLSQSTGRYHNDGNLINNGYFSDLVENNLDWFKLEEANDIDSVNIYTLDGLNHYTLSMQEHGAHKYIIRSTKPVSPETLGLIAKMLS